MTAEIGSGMTKDRKLLRAGSISTVVAAICCFTPALAVAVGFVGLSSIVVWLDFALFPILFASLGLVAYALHLHYGRTGPSPIAAIVAAVAFASGLLFWLEFRLALPVSGAAAASVAAYAYFLRRHVRHDAGCQAENRDLPT